MDDREQISELQAVWAEHDSDADAVGWSEVFTAGGRYISGRGEFVGREAIRKSIEDRTARNPPNRRTMHIFGPPVITITGDTATSVSAYVAYGRVGDGPWEVMTIGRFHCELARENGKWLYSSMHNRAIGTATGPASTSTSHR
jgi:hypothetical protein